MWPSLEHALNKEVRGRVMEAFIFQHFSTLFAMYVYAYVCVCAHACVYVGTCVCMFVSIYIIRGTCGSQKTACGN